MVNFHDVLMFVFLATALMLAGYLVGTVVT